MESESNKVHLILEEREKLYNPIKIVPSKGEKLQHSGGIHFLVNG